LCGYRLVGGERLPGHAARPLLATAPFPRAG